MFEILLQTSSRGVVHKIHKENILVYGFYLHL